MPEIRYREALNQAMTEEMERDPRIFLMGEEVAEYNGAYKVSEGMLEKFGAERVVDTPIAELGFVNVGVGAALAGLRPIIEVMTFNFAILSLDAIINSAAKARYMSNGQLSVPMVLRATSIPEASGGSLRPIPRPLPGSSQVSDSASRWPWWTARPTRGEKR